MLWHYFYMVRNRVNLFHVFEKQRRVTTVIAIRTYLYELGIFIAIFVGCLALQSCTLPRSGPMLKEVIESSERNDILLVPVTTEIALANRQAKRASFPVVFTMTPEVDYEVLAAGDGVVVRIWEKDGLGVFPVGPNGFSDLGEFVLDKAGLIYLPYIGQVHAAGLTAALLSKALIQRLSGIVFASDVNVRITERRGQIVTLLGDLAKPGSYSIGPGILRLSGLLTHGLLGQENSEQLKITLRRNGITGSVRLSDVYESPAEDIALRSGDLFIVQAIADHFTVLGAAAGQSRIKLTKRNYSVVDALGDARGLNDATADPRGVFLFRSQTAAGTEISDPQPIIYQFDFRRPDHVLLANQFAVKDGDAIYISDAPFGQLQKVLSSFSATIGTAGSVAR